MLFVGWVECPSMKFCIHSSDEGYYTTKYTANGNKVADSRQLHKTKNDLESFLRSIPLPPNEIISDLMNKL